jgi:hypothetical protein
LKHFEPDPWSRDYGAWSKNVNPSGLRLRNPISDGRSRTVHIVSANDGDVVDGDVDANDARQLYPMQHGGQCPHLIAVVVAQAQVGFDSAH